MEILHQFSDTIESLDTDRYKYTQLLLECHDVLNVTEDDERLRYRVLPDGTDMNGIQHYVGLSKLKADSPYETNVALIYYESVDATLPLILRAGTFYKETISEIPVLVQQSGIEFSRQIEINRLGALCDMLRTSLILQEK